MKKFIEDYLPYAAAAGFATGFIAGYALYFVTWFFTR